MTGIKIACQTYSWQMRLEAYQGRLAHIAEVARAAGFDAIEPEMVILGDDRSVDGVSAAVAPYGITIPSLVLAEEWSSPQESAEERERLEEALTLARGLGAEHLVLVQASTGRDDLHARQATLMERLRGVAARATEYGVSVSLHPNSVDTSLFRDAHDYDRLEEILPDEVGLTPDLGHVARGGMDVLETVRRFRSRIVHVHAKDMAADGSWARTGEGVVDLVGTVRHLHETGFDGWIAFEDESSFAKDHPDEATRSAGAWIAANLAPYTQQIA
ncbi:sugar phosphate isomerase/epimerase family protein [Agromyces aerolatus]|uniref:sugar phosphate isomerase/epimerase family protein n=1 Tax=Agromyces sp. LY-1074 TaxID=3074080 RepID=UPI0028558EF2|nr:MULTISPECIES: sugar phosphate isomerase/epimerase [unclassified Agromyces]MDR5700899.1 sugar phosphate isomerase/epimerase [Agromyces sp. LY-1074]MDR5707440.1 sugar phosphate isomerase/epimerase [Agromyces sp. LY-1358]